MRWRHLVAGGCRHEPAKRPAPSDLIAFTVTSNLDISCSGIWSVDRSGTLRWLAGVPDSSPSPRISFSWLGDGDTVAYLAIVDEKESLWVANADGTDARLLARNVERFAASPDGTRIAFRRLAKQNFREELWLVDVGTGARRRVPGKTLPDRSQNDIWLTRGTLVVHDQFPGAGSDEDDAIRVDLSSGARSLLARDMRVLQVSSDGSTLVAIRKYLLGAGTDLEEEVIAVVTVRPDGTGERLLAVTDAQTGNIHGVPVLQPVAHDLSVAKDFAPPPGVEQRCRSELIALRERVTKG